ncbi:hypothetical protein [Kitasatospora kifunensis]|uniref:Uncharacterized protein n=1 Tax=Kitasatospora kifunensis TaxID=58351 RepID=A0A7W7RBI4_KITKI|nr:hypothetical protein [Kitasatospora kifunensis]MBB4928909.1 hypothetical protein [Kitasatospora kifunensis]
MSYDLTVWEGELPTNDAAARAVFSDLYGEFMGGRGIEPTARIRQCVEALVTRWPDLSPDDEDEDASPWSSSPLIKNASGPSFYFGMAFSKYQEAGSYAAEVARSAGLVCFDPGGLGKSSLQVTGVVRPGLARCSRDRFDAVEGGAQAAVHPQGAASPRHRQGRGAARAQARERGAASPPRRTGPL